MADTTADNTLPATAEGHKGSLQVSIPPKTATAESRMTDGTGKMTDSNMDDVTPTPVGDTLPEI